MESLYSVELWKIAVFVQLKYCQLHMDHPKCFFSSKHATIPLVIWTKMLIKYRESSYSSSFIFISPFHLLPSFTSSHLPMVSDESRNEKGSWAITWNQNLGLGPISRSRGRPILLVINCFKSRTLKIMFSSCMSSVQGPFILIVTFTHPRGA